METVDDESCPTAPAMRKTVERLIAEIPCRDRCARLSLNLLEVSATASVFARLKYKIESGWLPDGSCYLRAAFIASDREG